MTSNIVTPNKLAEALGITETTGPVEVCIKKFRTESASRKRAKYGDG
ncbi:MAG: hypothetical protein OXC26_05815 [Albidovulum sp.]|nr:hypothetical protein [Albidovulum sp.]